MEISTWKESIHILANDNLELFQKLLSVAFQIQFHTVPPEILDMERLFQLAVYGNNLSNLAVVDGRVICSALGGEHYCDCRNQCINDPVEPDRSACAEGQACCEELFTSVTPCTICEDGFREPNMVGQYTLSLCFCQSCCPYSSAKLIFVFVFLQFFASLFPLQYHSIPPS